MKRSIFVICMVLCLLLCACGDASQSTSVETEDAKSDVFSSEPISSETEPVSSESEEVTESKFIYTVTIPTPVENSAFAAYKTFDMDVENQGTVWGGTIGVVVNEPFGEELEPTIRLNEGECDRLYIIPRFVGSRVYVYEIFEDEDGRQTYSDEPVYSVENTEDGCIIYAALARPEGIPRWCIEIVSPNYISDCLTLTYDGKDGTPHLEYLEGFIAAGKPVIYLYPEVETEVSVQLDYQGKLTCTYPAYQNGWTVTAQPDGTLTDTNGQVYNYLYWEGQCATAYDFSQGFCVKGSDTAAFLETALAQLGLNRKEANEFIVYWLPMMQENEYNVIAFQTDTYTETAPLTITPAADTLLRVFMAWYGSDTAVEIAPQTLTAPERTGFTVVEWGGSEVK